MAGMRNSCFLFSSFLFISSVSSILGHTLNTNDVLTSNRTIVSENHDFELGFFNITSKTGDGERCYIGIWYKAIPEKVRQYVWIANRDKPLSNSAGTLQISHSNLVLRDEFGTIVWSSNVTTALSPPSPVVAKLLPNGNFVLRDKIYAEKISWQSFDFPTDTLLPDMRLGLDKGSGFNRILTSWRSEDDPSSGDCLLKIDDDWFPQLSIWCSNSLIYRIDPFLPTSERSNSEFAFIFTVNEDQVTYSFATANKPFSRITLTFDRVLKRLTWDPANDKWNTVWTAPNEVCDNYKTCLSNAICDMDVAPSVLTPVCRCYQGFEKKASLEESQCVRKTPLNCAGDGFYLQNKMKLPDTKAAIMEKITGPEECKKKCLDKCLCTAFVTMDMPSYGLVCLIWTGNLTDLRIFTTEGHDLYVKLAAADLEEERDTSRSKGLVIGIAVGIIALITSFPVFWFWRQKHKRARAIPPRETSIDLVAMDQEENLVSGAIITGGLAKIEFEQLVNSTNGFSDSTKLGEGGFGAVYKGRLLDGNEIAVKRLTEMTVMGRAQFRNEVELIGKLQHLNLVRLLGYCQNSQEHILIYEFLENLSLASYLFGDTTQRCQLNCQRRLEITKGIARGLQYLHTDSRFRIIHRDVKASNILLDKDMIPKISDFGMARLIGNDETGDETKVIVGTMGYMAPEYMIDGIFSIKSDVFSFGVLLIEILSGKRNTRFENSYGDSSLLTCVWRNWEEGSLMEIVDSCIVDWSSHKPQVLRCFHIGLLCVQERAEDRPTMPSVVVMLEGEAAIPQPKPPGYLIASRRYNVETGSCSPSGQTDDTWNEFTTSVIDPR